MKANAPERLYLSKNIYSTYLYQVPDPDDETAVEYTRTDAFIEKVRGWLKDCATFTDMNGKKRIDKEMYKATVEDFKKYMEGE